MRQLIVVTAVAAILCAGCASYTTPGAAVNIGDIDGADAATAATRLPSPHFPANIALVRVQAPDYKSYSVEAYGKGRFSVVPTQELLAAPQMQAISQWPSVQGATQINAEMLPPKFDSLDDLRLPAAKVQADVLLVYTLDTQFTVQGRSVAPLASIALSPPPDHDAAVASTASAIFIDVRTGFIYGRAQASAQSAGLADAWKSQDSIDKKRIDAEQQAVSALLPEAAKVWSGIASRYQ